jgi:predicted nucleotidyltransferase component of viral defense system
MDARAQRGFDETARAASTSSRQRISAARSNRSVRWILQQDVDAPGKLAREIMTELKPLRKRFDELRKSSSVQLKTFEIDYLISFVLAGISGVDSLAGAMAFKGGTALRKCYFSDYRFSEDLDFSAFKELPKGADLDEAVKMACQRALALLQNYERFEIKFNRMSEKAPHPHGQQAFVIYGKFPWHTNESTWARVKLEITVDEKILLPTPERPIIHSYGEELTAGLLTYSLEEIVAEKLRALLQWAQKLESKGFAKPRGRDYFDLWQILIERKSDLDLTDFKDLLKQKADSKSVSYAGVESFFYTKVLEDGRANWDNHLNHLVDNLPDFDGVIAGLQVEVQKLLS